MRRFFLCSTALLVGCSAFADSFAVQTLTTDNVNVRSLDGDTLCSVAHSANLTAIARKDDMVEVTTDNPKCPRGYIYQQLLQPKDQSTPPTAIDTNDGSVVLRGEPSVDGRYLCSLARGTKVQVEAADYPAKDGDAWVKVKVNNGNPDCSDEGYVDTAFLNPPKVFNKLPAPDDKDTSIDNLDCPACHPQTPAQKNQDDLHKVAAATMSSTGHTYADGLRQLIANPAANPPNLTMSRKLHRLAQMPLNNDSLGACGSLHYNSHHVPGQKDVTNSRVDHSGGSNYYASPLAACDLLSVMAKWKRDTCPDSTKGCQIAIGDISNRDASHYDGHDGHKDGNCADIRPLRIGDAEDSGLTDTSKNYDRTTTLQLIAMLRSAGANHILYNDPVARREYQTEYYPGHSNHIHVCFLPSKTHDGQAEKNCAEFLQPGNIDSFRTPNLCPEL